MATQRLPFTPKNIMSAWEAVGIIPFNPRRVLGVVKPKQEAQNVSHPKVSVTTVSPIPKTLRAVCRVTQTAFSLVTRKNSFSVKLKELLSGLSEGFQQTIADKVVEEEAHGQYRQLVGTEKQGKTSDGRKLTEATLATWETVIQLWDVSERIDAAKAGRKANKESRSPGGSQTTKTKRTKVAVAASGSGGELADMFPSINFHEAQDLLEEMEALAVSGHISGEDSGGAVEDTIQVRGKQ